MTATPTSHRRPWIWIAVAAAILFLICCACAAALALFFAVRGGGGGVFQGASATAEIGPQGGEVALGGARLVFPPGSLGEPLQVQLRQVDSPPEIPAEFLVSPAGPAFEITLPGEPQLAETAELQLPYESLAGADPALYAVFAWDGASWRDVGGRVEGDRLLVQLERFSIFRPVNTYIPRRPVGFANHGPDNAGVRPWTYVPLYSDTPAPPPLASTTAFGPGAPGGWPNPSAYLSLPLGTYTFCVDYNHNNTGEYYHFILGSPSYTLTLNDPAELSLARMIDFGTDGTGHQRGRCPIQSPAAQAGAGQPGAGTAVPQAGAVTIRLSWSTIDDLDLHVTEPSGERIYYGNRQSASGGQLDVDSNAACASQTTTPVENVYWPASGAPRGEYSVRVHVWGDCDDVPEVAFRLRIMSDGRVIYDSGGVLQGDGDEFIYTFSR